MILRTLKPAVRSRLAPRIKSSTDEKSGCFVYVQIALSNLVQTVGGLCSNSIRATCKREIKYMKAKYMLVPAAVLACLLASCAEKSTVTSFSDPTVLSGTWAANSTTLNSRGSNETEKILMLEFTEQGTITGTAKLVPPGRGRWRPPGHGSKR